MRRITARANLAWGKAQPYDLREGIPDPRIGVGLPPSRSGIQSAKIVVELTPQYRSLSQLLAWEPIPSGIDHTLESCNGMMPASHVQRTASRKWVFSQLRVGSSLHGTNPLSRQRCLREPRRETWRRGESCRPRTRRGCSGWLSFAWTGGWSGVPALARVLSVIALSPTPNIYGTRNNEPREVLSRGSALTGRLKCFVAVF